LFFFVTLRSTLGFHAPKCITSPSEPSFTALKSGHDLQKDSNFFKADESLFANQSTLWIKTRVLCLFGLISSLFERKTKFISKLCSKAYCWLR